MVAVEVEADLAGTTASVAALALESEWASASASAAELVAAEAADISLPIPTAAMRSAINPSVSSLCKIIMEVVQK